MNVFLIGITGVGKSVIGKKLARLLHTNFVDLDAYIQIREKKTIPELFYVSEANFRRAEREALLALEKIDNHVIATGGGIVLNPDNIDFMKKNGFIIHLYRNIDHIAKHINIQKRPLLKDRNAIYRLYEQRKAIYKSCADVSVDCNHQVNAITEIMDVIKKRNIL